MKPKMERREFVVREFRVQDAADEGGMPTLEGYASVFNEQYDVWDFREQVAPGAFAETIKVDDIVALWNHDSAKPLARVRADNLTLSEDDHGLKVVFTPTDTQYARDLIQNIRARVVDQMSFGFRVTDQKWDTVDGVTIRTLKKVRLYDVSPVTYPASPATEIDEQRSREIYEQAQRDGLIPPVQEDGAGSEVQEDRALRANKLEIMKRTFIV